MARIRSIKPEITSDRKLARVSIEARLTFIYTWTIADDAGLFRAEERQLLGALFPHDVASDSRVTRETLDSWLEELASVNVLRWRTTFDGSRVGEIVNWRKHQKIDRPSTSHILKELQPLTPASRGRAREPLAKGSRAPRDTLAAGVLSPDLGSSPRASRETWATAYGDAWIAAYGGEPHWKQLAKYLSPLHKKHGPDKTLTNWRNYVASTQGAYASLARFAATFGSWSVPQVAGLPPGVKPDDRVYDDDGQPTAAGRAAGL